MASLATLRNEQLNIFSNYASECTSSSERISQLMNSNSGSVSDLLGIKNELRSFISSVKKNRGLAYDVNSKIKELQADPKSDTDEFIAADKNLFNSIIDSKKSVVDMLDARLGPGRSFASASTIDMYGETPLIARNTKTGVSFIIYGSYDESFVGADHIKDALYGAGFEIKTGDASDSSAESATSDADSSSDTIDDDSGIDDDSSGDEVASPEIFASTSKKTFTICLVELGTVGLFCFEADELAGWLMDVIGSSGCQGNKVQRCKCRCRKKFDRCMGGAGGGGIGPGTTEEDDMDLDCHRELMECQDAC